MIVISKEFEGDFGHRVWSQKLDEEFAGTTTCKCKALHGHRFKIVPEIASDLGLQHGMVTDFTHFAKFKEWIDLVMDHKLLMDINDPVLKQLFPLLISHKGSKWKYEKAIYDEESCTVDELEIYDGLIIVEFVPTAENIAQWLAVDILPKFLPSHIYVTALTFYETPKSFAKWIS